MSNTDNYKTIDEADIEYLRSVCAPERVIPGPAVGEDYCHDELSGIRRRPDVLVKAASTKEVSAIMKYAYQNCIPVTPRGQGTGLVGGAVPLHGGILLDLSGMNR
ncbi:MAG: FAD-binding oxidoreductase, partial [Victivallales bacterium]|nr:FAD-binding oxidoreductase [Victivallales bacterium]